MSTEFPPCPLTFHVPTKTVKLSRCVKCSSFIDIWYLITDSRAAIGVTPIAMSCRFSDCSGLSSSWAVASAVDDAPSASSADAVVVAVVVEDESSVDNSVDLETVESLSMLSESDRWPSVKSEKTEITMR